jgi:selenocysteine lyase/cysteine desulfurase
VPRIRDYLLDSNVQLGATYDTGKLSTSRVNEGFEAGARYINAGKDEIGTMPAPVEAVSNFAANSNHLVYGSSTTQLFRNLSQTLTFQAGEEIIISALDHEANIASWVDLAERQQLVIKWWQPGGQGSSPKLTADNLAGLLTDKTRLLAFTHCSNIMGTIHDVKAISAAAHKFPNVLVCVDAVAYAPHRPIDVKDLGVDFYAFSWYKVFGPHIAMLYASQTAQEQMRSLGHYFNPKKTLSEKIGLASGSYELVAGIPVLTKELTADGWDGPIKQEAGLQSRLLDYLKKRKDVTVYGEVSSDSALRVPTISFRVAGWSSREVVETVEAKTNLGFRWGHFYSHRLVKDVLGLDPADGVVRFSMAHYNTGK